MGLMWMVSQSQTGRCSAVPRRNPEWALALIRPGIRTVRPRILYPHARRVGCQGGAGFDLHDQAAGDGHGTAGDDGLGGAHGDQDGGGQDRVGLD